MQNIYLFIPLAFESSLFQFIQVWNSQSEGAFVIVTGVYKKKEGIMPEQVETTILGQTGITLKMYLQNIDDIEGAENGYFELIGFMVEAKPEQVPQQLPQEIIILEGADQAREFLNNI